MIELAKKYLMKWTLWIGIICSLGSLFAGQAWAQFNGITRPIQNAFKELNIQNPLIKSDRSHLTIYTKLTPGDSLRDIYDLISNKLKSVLGNRNLSIIITNRSSAQLDSYWNNVSMGVFSEIDRKNYDGLYSYMQAAISGNSNIKIKTEMNEHYIFIEMYDDVTLKYLQISRNSKLGGADE